jgi:uncharacterized protein (TIGR01244 family)
MIGSKPASCLYLTQLATDKIFRLIEEIHMTQAMQDPVGFAGQISVEQIPQVVEKGFRSVINNRPDMEGGAEQPTSAQIEEAARGVGLDYVYQPVVSGQIDEMDVRTFANHYNELPKPILMFCRTGNRSNNLYQLAKQMDLLDD